MKKVSQYTILLDILEKLKEFERYEEHFKYFLNNTYSVLYNKKKFHNIFYWIFYQNLKKF